MDCGLATDIRTTVPGDGLGLHLWTLDAEHLMLYFKVLLLNTNDMHQLILTPKIAHLFHQCGILC